MNAVRISIVMPVLNEAPTIIASLEALQDARHRGVEVIVVDGGSEDATVELAQALADQVLIAPRGRASQMNAGAVAAHGTVLWFVHADTRVTVEHEQKILWATAHAWGGRWGRFDVRIDSRNRLLALVSKAINIRSRWSGIATGDQAIFVSRILFERVGGFPDLPLMEDVALSKRLKCIASPACFRETVLTSARRWEKHGLWRTIFLMWSLRAAYFMGVSPHFLARQYGYLPRD
ncbi:MAG: TIGR04283 family arsenosugar biosynthesis glycosyltransferase [Rhodocyclaceae bacterium]|nr:TIGR04283 family arsenosugar biosynthesis glycosyltransferase [Rhodocyclaceae bacterium]